MPFPYTTAHLRAIGMLGAEEAHTGVQGRVGVYQNTDTILQALPSIGRPARSTVFGRLSAASFCQWNINHMALALSEYPKVQELACCSLAEIYGDLVQDTTFTQNHFLGCSWSNVRESLFSQLQFFNTIIIYNGQPTVFNQLYLHLI